MLSVSKTLFSGRKRKLSTWKGEAVPCNLVVFPSIGGGLVIRARLEWKGGEGVSGSLGYSERRKGLVWLFLEGWEGDGEAALIKQDEMAASV